MMNKRKVAKILLLIVAIIVLLFGVLIGLAYYFEKEIKAYSIAQIENQIGVSIKVDDIQFSFIRKFPMASLWFKNVVISGSCDSIQKTELIKASRIFLNFNVRDIFNKNYRIHKIEVEDAGVTILVNEKGVDNYHIFKSNADTTSLFFQLKNIQLKNTNFTYNNKQIKHSFSFFIEKNNSSLAFNNDYLNLGFDGNGIFNSYFIDEVQLINDKKFTLKTHLKYLINDYGLLFENSSIQYELISINIKGSIKNIDKEPLIDLYFSSTETEISKIIAELDDEKQEQLDAFNLKGKLAIKASAKGLFSSPEIKAQVQISNGSAVYKGYTIEQTYLTADFSNGLTHSLESCVLEIKNFKTMLEKQKTEGSIKITDLRNSKITALLKGSIDLALIEKLFPESSLKEIRGTATFDSKLYVELNQLLSQPTINPESLQLYSTLKLYSTSFYSQSLKQNISNLTGDFTIDNLGLQIINLNFIFDKKSITYSGLVSCNWSKYIKSEPQRIDANGKLYLSQFDIKMLSIFNSSESKTEKATVNKYIVNLETQVDTFIFDGFTAFKNKGFLHYDGTTFSLANLQISSCDGTATGDLKLNFLNNGNTSLESSAKIENINITKLFSSFNNFGQQMITNQNLKGSVNAKVNFSASYDKNFNLIPKSVKSSALISIAKGELNGIKELNALSNYTKVKDFSSIKFSELTNTINIRNDSIFIPEMEIKSDKLNMSLYGTHSFENSYDYHFKILLTEILAKKIERVKATEFGDVIDDESGKTTIFIHLYGKGDNFTVKYDKAAVGKKIQTDLRKEKESIKTILKNEFKILKSDTVSSAASEKEKEQMKKQESGKFVIEWEEK